MGTGTSFGRYRCRFGALPVTPVGLTGINPICYFGNFSVVYAKINEVTKNVYV